MRLDIYGRRSGAGKRTGHVLYLTGADQRWLGEALMDSLPDLGRRVLIAQERDMVVVSRGELHALRRSLDRQLPALPERLQPLWYAAVQADDAEKATS